MSDKCPNGDNYNYTAIGGFNVFRENKLICSGAIDLHAKARYDFKKDNFLCECDVNSSDTILGKPLKEWLGKYLSSKVFDGVEMKENMEKINEISFRVIDLFTERTHNVFDDCDVEVYISAIK